jgi:hypothetical protein
MNAITANEVGIRLSPSVGLALGTGVFGLKDRSLARLADASDRRDNHRHLGEENLGNLCLAGDNAGHRTLSNDLPFELAEGAQHIHHEPAGGSGGIQVFRQRFKTDLFMVNPVQDSQ